MKARYEKSITGRWVLVVYHIDPWRIRPDDESISPLLEVPESCIHNGEPMFGAIAEWYPAPIRKETP